MRLVEREHASGRCPPPDERKLGGAGAAGTACTAASECAPHCCACTGSSVAWLAAACVGGLCADAAGACTDPPSPGFCDEVHAFSTTTGSTNHRCDKGGGAKKPGEPCTDGAQCVAACCPCEGQGSWRASACVNGTCAGRSAACAVATPGDDYCMPPPARRTRSVRGEQLDGSCPAAPTQLVGRKRSGQRCAAAEECAPSCCACGAGANSWLAGACIDGHCSDPEIACIETENDARYCDGRCRGPGGPCWRGNQCCSGGCEGHRCR